jgi:hypothetical protein
MENAIMRVTEGNVNIQRYTGISCETCVHKSNNVNQFPCNKCTSAVKTDERDYRVDDFHYWLPNELATAESIRYFYQTYKLRKLDYLEYKEPVRCINPKCQHGYLVVYDRGLCRGCYKSLDSLVEKHREAALKLLILAASSESDFEYEAYLYEYYSLYTWQRFVLEQRALPKEEDFQGDLKNYGIREYIDTYRELERPPTKEELQTKLTNIQLTRLQTIINI